LPESYTPKHLAEKILTSKSALEGERKQVTVLFADLKGSMELLADRDPEEARKLLDPVVERMMESVHRYEGTVNQVMGDGIMALFGAPLAHEDHAVRACYAALRMQRRVNLYADELQRAGGTPVHIRVGLNSGEVVVRAIGSDLHMDYTAVGQTTHLAARMEQMAKPGSVLMTGDTLKLAEGFVQVKPLGPVTVKGLEITTQVYELTGVGTSRSRFQVSATRGLTRFVGRDNELRQLAQALERAAAGHGQAVAVVGEPGVGKSRLAWEFTRSHRTHGWLVLESGSVSYGKATPYLPVIDLLKAYCRIQERDDPRAIRERVAGKLLMLDRALEPLLTPLLGLLDVPVDDAAWDALDPTQRRQRTLEAVKRLLLRESQVQPLLVVFEDLHWIDSETQALLDGLVESLPTARVLLLVNYRPEYQHPWGRKTYYLQLRIDPLEPDSADALLDALLGEDRTLGPLKRVLIARTEGNPFFLEETVQALVETQVLVGERGAYRMTRAPEALQIPATAQAILAARIDRLSPEDKRLLQAASVVGKDVPFALVQAIADVTEDSLRQGLARLQGAEFLYETSLFPDLEYTFKHALTHDVAYGSLLQERRRALHARIVDAMEEIYPDRLGEHAERLAHHAVRGEVWDRAFRYLRQAGAKAYAHSAYPQAATCFEEEIRALAHLPETRDRLEQEYEARVELRHALFMLGDAGRMHPVLTELASVAERLGNPARVNRAIGYMGNYCWWTGQPDRALPLYERQFMGAGGGNQFSFGLGQVYHALGEYRRAVPFLSQAVAFSSGDRIRERGGAAGFPAVFTRTWLALVLAECGEMRAAQGHADDAVKVAEALDHPWSLVLAETDAGRLALYLRDVNQAVTRFEHAGQVARTFGLTHWRPWTAAGLGLAYAWSGRLKEAFPIFQEAEEHAAASQFRFGHALRVAWEAEAHLLAGRSAEAWRGASRALELARQHRERGHEAWVLRLLAEVASHPAALDAEQARARYADTIRLASELDMRPLVAHCHLGLARLHWRAGDRVQAQECLTGATAMYREMGMPYWLEQAEAAFGPRGSDTSRAEASP
jgi:class 3 adenylate cyclase/tetratricopeptide (TPR) repeat protein